MSRILLGVSGGIAAYKALELVRLATAPRQAVRVVPTPARPRLVRGGSFAALTGAPGPVRRVERRPPPRGLSRPASANTIAKLAAGMADNLLTSCALAADCPLVLAPAMNNRMYEHPATRANLQTLRQRGVHIVEPDAGRLASAGEQGVGRLAEPQ